MDRFAADARAADYSRLSELYRTAMHLEYNFFAAAAGVEPLPAESERVKKAREQLVAASDLSLPSASEEKNREL